MHSKGSKKKKHNVIDNRERRIALKEIERERLKELNIKALKKQSPIHFVHKTKSQGLSFGQR
jgi:hypothetical protein